MKYIFIILLFLSCKKPELTNIDKSEIVNNAVWLDYDGFKNYAPSGLDSVDIAEIMDSLNIYFKGLDIVFTTDSSIKAKRIQHTVITARYYNHEQGAMPSNVFGGDYPVWCYVLPGNPSWGIANNIAHETGHALKLVHNSNTNDLMNGKQMYRYARFNANDFETMKNALVY